MLRLMASPIVLRLWRFRRWRQRRQQRRRLHSWQRKYCESVQKLSDIGPEKAAEMANGRLMSDPESVQLSPHYCAFKDLVLR